ncbi:MAG TPA: SNF2-related protein [Candidatus Eisenbacteria bacterium]|nr:SNF2-related protein [Candidatus Eisenbacteria bacterium]
MKEAEHLENGEHEGYRVGQRIKHPQFGEGLIVDVRHGRASDVIEVVFGTELKRLSGRVRWPLAEDEAAAAAPTGERPAPQAGGPGAAGGLAGFDTVEDEATPYPSRLLVEATPESRGLVQRWLDDDRVKADLFEAGVRAERFSAWAAPDRLITIDSLRGVERFAHQHRAALRIMRDLGGRGLLADEVGLGKTIEAGIVLKEYLLRGLVRTVLVLVPASLVEQWAEELREKFELDFMVSRGADGAWGQHPLIIASLETARHQRHRQRVRHAGYDLVVVDEAHRLRNHLTLGWKFVNELGARYPLLLTATPVQNDLRELYNLVTLIRPGAVGTFAQFKREFMTSGDRLRPQNVEKLRELLAGVMVRSQRAQTHIQFPKRHVITIPVELEEAEADLYADVSDFVISTIQNGDEKVRQQWYFTLVVLQKEMGSSTAAAAGTLRRLAERSGSGLETKRLNDLARRAEGIHESKKVKALVALLKGLKEKAIVFTQFRGTQELLANALADAGLQAVLYHGEQDWQEKEEALEIFRSKVPFLISTEAGGEGRNLQFCHHVVNYDLPWNPMRVEQRIGRVHRLGQTSDVYIHNLVARGTIESYVIEILEKKIQLFEMVVGEVEEILGHWNPEGSFEDEIFRIWLEGGEPADVQNRYTEFATRLSQARKRYLQEQELQKVLLPTEEKN